MFWTVEEEFKYKKVITVVWITYLTENLEILIAINIISSYFSNTVLYYKYFSNTYKVFPINMSAKYDTHLN